MHKAEIGQFERPIAARDILDEVDYHVSAIAEPERKRVDKFQNIAG
jgi:hypothetical protein